MIKKCKYKCTFSVIKRPQCLLLDPLVIILLLMTVSITSCKKYLDEKSDSSLVIPTSVSDLQALLDFPEHINYATPMFPEASCDDYFTLDLYYNILSGTRNAFAYTWRYFDYVYPNDWAAGYRPIYTANLCLESIDKVNRTPQNAKDWDNVKGTALFLRAYYFLNLTWTFAKAYDESTSSKDLGIVLRLSSDFNIPSVRSTVKASYEQVIADAKGSINYLPSNPTHVMRPSKAAGYGLLARAYLSVRNYDSAFKYANLALTIKNELLDFNDPSEINVNSNNPFLNKFHKEVVFYTQINSSFLSISSNSAAFVDTFLFASYDDKDLRKTAFFRTGLMGYKQYKNYNTGASDMFSGIATNELYLIRAECYARGGNNNGTGDKDAALSDLNKVLSNRWQTGFFTPKTATTNQEALTLILKERRKELIRRGLRWIDIKRLNKEGANIIPMRKPLGQTFSLQPNESKYALPIPNDIILQTGMQQN